ncbi:coproporphyrinogen III oxidase [Clostridia bacterium]|nr:coproporphyrinogen III oxidase [Clostridia bacterium]
MIIVLETNLPSFSNDIADVVRMMMPGAIVRESDDANADKRISHTHTEHEGYWHEQCTIAGNSTDYNTFDWQVPIPQPGAQSPEAFTLNTKRLLKRAAKQCCYYLLKNITHHHPPWGALTGIRPTRLFAERLAAGDPDPERTIMQSFDTRQDKAALLRSICETQSPYLSVDPCEVDIYVGIPYCVTRCAYCSFKTEIIPKDPRKTDAYVSALVTEIQSTRELMDECGLQPHALYMGGGTPTALEASRLDNIITALDRAFPNVLEFTVEAGRPDTLDGERLKVLRSHPVTRISINPQTMNDSTLERIGRRHTAAQTIDAFDRARTMGFNNINMDLIAALPGESVGDFARTLEAVQTLQPDSLTIHTLARKRASKLFDDPAFIETAPETVEEMILLGAESARQMGMRPYYLYRQKQIAGNQENVGYAKPDRISIYNIDMMEETASILALGAGGISKRVMYNDANQLRIERAPNMMESARYIERLDEMIERKRALWSEPNGNNKGV